MIRVFLKIDSTKIEELTNYIIGDIVISGDKSQVARQVTLKLMYNFVDSIQPNPDPCLGQSVWIKNNDNIIFNGRIFSRDYSYNEGTITIDAFDYLIYLVKSKGYYNFKNITPEAICKKVCSDYGIPIGNIVSTGINISNIYDGSSLYEIIINSYRQAGLTNGKEYAVVMNNLSLEAIERGKLAPFIIDTYKNTISTKYSDTLENSVNKVLIYDDKGNYFGKVQNDYDMKTFGTLQEVYKKEEKKEPYQMAKKILKRYAQTMEVECLDNWNCRTHYAVHCYGPYYSGTGNRVMYIDTDEHVYNISTGKAIMRLGLNFNNKISDDDVEINKEENNE